MKIASNSLSSVINFYKAELASVYSASELQNILRWILEKQLGLTLSDITSHPNLRINESDMTPLEKMCYELKANKPIQYVLGEAEFYEMKFKVNESVLIPRPETEELVEMVIKDISSLQSRTSYLVPLTSSSHNTRLSPLVLDIGTGSGCIPISIKKNIPQAQVFALDISESALEIARHNATVNHVSVGFFRADILLDTVAEQILEATGGQKLDVIISNPPYILQSESASLHERVRAYEPHTALFVPDSDPLLFYRKIAHVATKTLKTEGKLWFECHSNHAAQVRDMLVEMHFANVVLHNDLSGLPRFAAASPHV